MRAYWKFYRDVNIFNLIACFIIFAMTSIIWLTVMYCTVGIAFGLFGYHNFFRQQYYFYFNLGYSKFQLIKITFFINFIIALPFIILFSLIS